MKSAYAIAILSILGGLLVHLMVLLVIQIQGPETPPPPSSPHQVQFIGNLTRDAAPSVIEQAALNDSAPLFMPTEWNLVSQVSNVASLQSATEIFEPFAPLLIILDAKPTAPINGGSDVQSQAVRLPQGPAFILSRFGRKEFENPVAASEGISFRVSKVDVPGSDPAIKQQLPDSINATAPESLWNPVQLFLQVNGGFPIGLPLVAQSSGFVDWDTSLQDYFTQLGFYSQLNDGYYQIWVYP